MHEKKNICLKPEELEKQNALLRSINEEWTAEFRIRQGRAPVYCVETYGCQMNERDSEHLKGMLNIAGFTQGDSSEADLILFNTCCVRDHAEQRVFGNIGALNKRKQLNPELLIGVCGCMMQQEETAKALYRRFPFVDMVFGTHSLHAFPQSLYKAVHSMRAFDVRQSDGHINEGLPTSRSPGVSAFATIMYGCDNFCSYCIVPYVRGRERSRSVEHIETEIKELIAEGVKEITLLGQNVNSYGADSQVGDFPSLLRRIDTFAGDTRIRFMTSHPKDLSAGLIEAMAECKSVCKHIHLPAQSGSDRILSRMNRKYTRQHYLGLINKLRSAIPEIEVTTDIIVGFPGETEEDFEATLELMREAKFAAAFTFMYSIRPGTVAAKMEDQIEAEVKKDRLLRLNELQALLSEQNNLKYIGKTMKVLVEGCEQGAFGKCDSSKTIFFDGGEGLVGQYADVLVEGCRKNSLIGKRV